MKLIKMSTRIVLSAVVRRIGRLLMPNSGKNLGQIISKVTKNLSLFLFQSIAHNAEHF